jgi:hypothetical protein
MFLTKKAQPTMFLDNRIHRILVEEGRIAFGNGIDAKLTTVTDDQTGEVVDSIVVSTATSSVYVKCNATYILPACGTKVCGPGDGLHKFPVPSSLDLRRVIVLNTELSADPTHSIVIVNNAPNKDVLIYSNSGTSLEVPADNTGIKIPPSTGE